MAEKTKAQLEAELAEAAAKLAQSDAEVLERLKAENPTLIVKSEEEIRAEILAQLKVEQVEAKGAPMPTTAADSDVNDYLNEKVKHTFFKDEDKYADDINVTINGHTWTIQRGVTVNLPRFVLDAVLDAENQAKVAANKMSELEGMKEI